MAKSNMAKEIIRVVDTKLRSQQNVKIIQQTSLNTVTAQLANTIQWFKDTFPSTAKENDCCYDSTDPTIDDGLLTASTTLTWASPRQIDATGDITLPDPTSDKNIAGSAIDHTGVVMFCIRNATTTDAIISVGYGSFVDYLFPGEVKVYRTGISQVWEV